jgi:hypothetical protein
MSAENMSGGGRPECVEVQSVTTMALQSVQSLLLVLQRQGQRLGTGTGFVAQASKGPVLLTNWHIVSGRRPDDNIPLSPTGQVPDEVVIIHNRANRLGEWVPKSEPLHDSAGPLWCEHPVLKQRADFVALPLTQLDDVQLYPYSLGVGDPQIKCGPADTVSVIGFPFGIQIGGSLAVWATGFVASEPDVDFDSLPLFLIDCRSRPGQSGSAVVSYRSGGVVGMDDGASAALAGPACRFLGIYSGRINSESDLGLVWKATAIRQLIHSM